MHMLQAIHICSYYRVSWEEESNDYFSLSRIERIVEAMKINLQKRQIQKRVLKILADPVHLHSIR